MNPANGNSQALRMTWPDSGLDLRIYWCECHATAIASRFEFTYMNTIQVELTRQMHCC